MKKKLEITDINAQLKNILFYRQYISRPQIITISDMNKAFDIITNNIKLDIIKFDLFRLIRSD